MFAGELRHSAGRPQFLAQFIGAIEMDFARLTRVVEHDNAGGFEMTGARDLNVADTMRAHVGQNMSFHKHFLIRVLVPYLSGDDNQVRGQIKIAKRFVIHPLQNYRRYVEFKVKEGWR